MLFRSVSQSRYYGLIQGLNDGLPIGLGQQWSQTVVFTILILLMTFRPTGLLGKPMVEKV